MVIATGYFDGVHLGHRFLLEALVKAARERKDESMVITFHPHPRAVLQKEASSFRLISSREEKKELILKAGVDHIEELEFTKEFAALTAAEYIDFLVCRFGCRAIVLGYDNRFGCDEKSHNEIASIAADKGVEVITLGACLSDSGIEVSSTKIRKAIESGDCKAANQMLGRPYSIYGIVVAGNRIGRTIGFPTANVSPCDPLKIIPKGGVYLSRVHCLGKEFYGMTNIGRRPTVVNSTEIVIETNIFDFSEDIYSLEISVEFLERIRDEVRFNSLSELSAQLSSDRNRCLSILQTLR